MKIKSLDHLVLTVTDITTSVTFYERFGMRAAKFTTTDGTERWALRFGTQKINLHQAGQEFAPHAAHPHTGSAYLCFLIDSSVEALALELGEDVIEGPIKRTGAEGPILSIYIKDPDGNLVELAEPLS